MKKLLLLLAVIVSSCDGTQASKEIHSLLSYGYGDSPRNAQSGYHDLMPKGGNFFNSCVPKFSSDSLYSSIFHHERYVQDLQNTCKDSIGQQDFVAIGHSRGAQMLIHFMGAHNPANLKAAVLVACPVSVGAAAKGQVWSNPTTVPEKTLQSIQSIHNKDLPIMLLHQENDHLVPLVHSKHLLQAFKDHGFNNVYLKVMKSGGHNDIVDPQAYKALQQFYKKHGLPFDASCGFQDPASSAQETTVQESDFNGYFGCFAHDGKVAALTGIVAVGALCVAYKKGYFGKFKNYARSLCGDVKD